MAYLKNSSRSACSLVASSESLSFSAFRSTTVLSRRSDRTIGARSDMAGFLTYIPDSLMKMDPNVLAPFSDFGIIVESGLGFTDRSIAVTCTCPCAKVNPLGANRNFRECFRLHAAQYWHNYYQFDRPRDIQRRRVSRCDAAKNKILAHFFFQLNITNHEDYDGFHRYHRFSCKPCRPCSCPERENSEEQQGWRPWER